MKTGQPKFPATVYLLGLSLFTMGSSEFLIAGGLAGAPLLAIAT
ncbi:hypothetical protein [Xenorhabdus szentirmaii]|nr:MULTISPECIES: hypothetical protein [unclassified Xenorhabdus]